MKVIKHFETLFDRHTYDEIVSLGTCCHPSFLIRDHRLSKNKKSYPFDWLATDSIDSIISAIDNDFEFFLETTVKKLPPTYDYDSLNIEKYRFVIPHHTKERFEIGYARKINNMLHLFKSPEVKNVLFILECHPFCRCTNAQAIKLTTVLNKKNKNNAKHHILIVNEYEEHEDIIEPLGLEQNCFIVSVKGKGIPTGFNKDVTSIQLCDERTHAVYKEIKLV